MAKIMRDSEDRKGRLLATDSKFLLRTGGNPNDLVEGVHRGVQLVIPRSSSSSPSLLAVHRSETAIAHSSVAHATINKSRDIDVRQVLLVRGVTPQAICFLQYARRIL